VISLYDIEMAIKDDSKKVLMGRFEITRRWGIYVTIKDGDEQTMCPVYGGDISLEEVVILGDTDD